MFSINDQLFHATFEFFISKFSINENKMNTITVDKIRIVMSVSWIS